MAAPIIVWFRLDLRLGDNRSLSKAVETGAPVIPVFVLDDETPGSWRIGGASRWWLHQSLKALSRGLADLGSRLVIRQGAAGDVIPALVAETGAADVHCQRRYEPFEAALERDLHGRLEEAGVRLRRFGGGVLHEPEAIATKTGDPYKVFTPYYRACLATGTPPEPLPSPTRIAAPDAWPDGLSIADLELLPTKPDWSTGFGPVWAPGEAGAAARLETFLETAAARYDDNRNRPDMPGTSRLSPHLHGGEISPRQAWHAALATEAETPSASVGVQSFLREIIWRDFSYHLLSHFPDLPERAFKRDFDAFPWRDDAEALRAWQRGQTGYPIVDAGMRELWHTGWMHNRVRMITASFLVKHLLLPWQAGEAWFWDTLVDADLASNSASWQWVAGSGADAAPYFRIFNPMTQGEKFDPAGAYVRHWVPELAGLDDADLQTPWKAKPMALKAAGVTLGETYPEPIVDHGAARQRALDAYDVVKAARTA